MAFALLHNGTTSSPVVSGISAPVAVANPNEPTGEHLTLTTDPACALWEGNCICAAPQPLCCLFALQQQTPAVPGSSGSALLLAAAGHG